MSIQSRILNINKLGVSYKALAQALEVSPHALRHYANGNQQTVECGENKIIKLLNQLEIIFQVN